MKLKEPLNGLLHLAGTILAVPALVVLIVFNTDSVWKIVSFSIYGSSLFLLFLFSTIYHWVPQKAGGKYQIFRKLDHLAIYVLIAGTYTPFCLVTLKNTAIGWTMFGVIWGLALIAMSLQAIYINLPRWLTTAFYIVMGWLIVIGIKPFLVRFPAEGFFYLLSGGIVYSIGGIIYTIKKPNLSKHFNYHALWHILVLIAALLHFFAMLFYVK